MTTLKTMSATGELASTMKDTPVELRLAYSRPRVERLGVNQATDGIKIPGSFEGADSVITFGS